jgi:subtilisin family serine protease
MWQPGDLTTPPVETTGRYLVLLPDDGREAGIEALQHSVDTRVLRTADLPPDALSDTEVAQAPAVVLDRIGIAVVTAAPGQIASLGAATAAAGVQPLVVEAERILYALERPVTSADLPASGDARMPGRGPAGASLTRDYLRGYRDAVAHLADAAGVGGAPSAALAAAAVDESQVTWGLQATGVPGSRYAGHGIKVAVLDTGFDVGHPDFAARAVVTQSFVAGEPFHDVAGHGTHCVGTSCGPRDPVVRPRYGIAYGAEIHAGKVLNDQGRGAEGDILAGLDWAIGSRCEVVSMSLGAPVAPGQPFSRVFERAARRALDQGTLIVAAAGNDSRRDLGRIAPVSHPANCPSVMAVAAVDSNLDVAYFSNGGTAMQGGQLDIAGPGYAVYSSWPMPGRYKTISGTSMATPHVAGIAALAAEADPGARGTALWSVLQQHAQRLPQPATDVGVGLVRAP